LPATNPGDAPASFRRPPRKRRWGFVLLLMLPVLALPVLGYFAYVWYVAPKQGTPQLTAEVKRGKLVITVSERAELESSKTIDVRCEVKTKEIKLVDIVPEGTRVTKGQEVCKLDTEELTRQRNEQGVKYETADGKAKMAEAELKVQENKRDTENAKAELTLTLARLDQRKYSGVNNIDGDYQVEDAEKEGDFKLAQKDLEEAQEMLANYEKFVKRGFGTPEQLRVKKLEVEQKKFARDSKKAKLDVLRNFTKERQETELSFKAKDAERELKRTQSTGDASVAKALSDRKAADITAKLEKEALDHFNEQLAGCVLKAPADGIIVYYKRFWDEQSQIRPGAMVYGQQPIFSIPDLEKMQMKVNIHESVVKKVKPGLEATIQIDAYPNKTLHGVVKSIATLASNEVWWDRNVAHYSTIVEIKDLPSEESLKPGFKGHVTILIKEIEDALYVPVQAVSQKDGKHCVYVAGPSGVECREVTLGDNNEKYVEIKEGLTEGERVSLDARARVSAEVKAKEGREDDGKKEGNSRKGAP
jgi:RND family efflux transporter MFP subunit